MTTKHLTLRVDAALLERLEAQSKRANKTRSEVAKQLLEEGLRMEAHPGIVFREAGNGERRPALADGPDVWVLISVLREISGTQDEIIAETAKLTDLSLQQVRTAARYYADYRDELDRWLDRHNEESEQLYAAWLREQQVFQR